MKTFATRIELIRQFPKSIGVEVGVCKGYFALEILEKADVRKLYCVDAWKGPVPGEPEFTDEVHEANYAETFRVLAGHRLGGRVEILRGRSVDMATRFPAASLDWVYLDASHAYIDVLDDLLNWSQRVRVGGAILGHDFTENGNAQKYGFGVVPAVTDFCQNFGWRMTAITSEEYPSYQLERA